jgi:two-component system phosphate regulon sensor histidine kinase PhoR
MTDPLAAAAFEALISRRGGDLLILVDERLRIARAGPEAAALAERDVDSLVDLSLIAAFGSATLDAVARSALATGETAHGEAELGHLGTRRFAIDAVPLVDSGLVISMHDITALRRIERVRRDFVANTGHELRTPITSIKLLAETISSGTIDDLATLRDFATQVEREADQLAQLVDELLDLTMIESGETKLALEALDPDQVIGDCAERIGPVAERRKVRVSVRRTGPTDVRAVGDPIRLGQALINLAHNAVKYSRQGGEIRLAWEATDDRVRFSVADDGIGVPEAHQPRIFERFYKVDRSRARDPEVEALGGSGGLGLAIVRHIAEAHGGTVGLTSEEGVGSTFWIEVPRA